jgi:predicted Zn-dependent protease with MMP-like domain
MKNNLTDEEFDHLISRAMDELPQEYIKGLDNVAILYADEPSDEQKPQSSGGLLLGLYEGIPLTQRGAGYTFVLPDRITLFKNAILQVVSTPDELYEQIKRTLWHEIAHYYGLDHDRIHELED